ncbi:hypothetical protein BsWGS_25289 [Bradybaena similaris]
MQSLAKRSRIMLKVFIAWTLSLIFPLPQLFIFVQYNSGLKHDGTPRRICGSRGYTAPWQRKLYFTYTTVYILIIPMVIMLYCYAKIIKVVWIRAKNETSSCVVQKASFKANSACSTHTESSRGQKYKQENSCRPCRCGYDVKATRSTQTSENMKRDQHKKNDKYLSRGNYHNKSNYKRHEVDDEDSNPGSPRMSVRRGLVSSCKRRVLIMTLTVVISFLVCHTPYFCISLMRIYSDYKLQLEMAMVVSQFLVLVHSTLNPILYGLFTLRDYHIKYIIAVLMCSKPSIAQPSKRFVHNSDERHELLTSVRSRLVSFSDNGRTTTTLAHCSYNTNIHVNPIIDLSSNTEGAPKLNRVSQSVSSMDKPLSSSVHVHDFRSKSVPVICRQVKKKEHRSSGAIVFSNVDVNQSSNIDQSLPEEKEPWKFNSRQLLTHSASH